MACELRDGWVYVTVPSGVTLRRIHEDVGHRKTHVQFYNQDWYLREAFLDTEVPVGTYRISPTTYVSPRLEPPPATEPLPMAGLCAFAFFEAFKRFQTKLWPLSYVWCSDFDRYGDRIYVGGYELGNTAGFQVHRHLTLKPHHGTISWENVR